MSALPDVPRAEQAARIRAAIAYSGKEAEQVADDVAAQLDRGFSYPTLRRRYNRDAPEGFKSLDELHAIADACGVPRDFLLEGFNRFGLDGTHSLAQRVAANERRLDEIARAFEERAVRLGEQVRHEAPRRAPSSGRS